MCAEASSVFFDVLAGGAVEEEVLGPVTAGCSFSFLARCSSSSYYIVLYCVILYCIVLYCIILHTLSLLLHPPSHTQHTHEHTHLGLQ
jgi:hypothetical protein